MSRRQGLFLTVSICLSLCMCSYANGESVLDIKDITVSANNWIKKCKSIKSKYMKMALKKGVYTPFNVDELKNFEGTNINVDGLIFPLPKSNYKISEIKVDEDFFLVRVKVGKEFSFVLRREGVDKMSDLWARYDSVTDKSLTTREGERYTTQMYGEDVSIIKLFVDSFEKKPSDIMCEVDKKYQDIRIIKALELKIFAGVDNGYPRVSYFNNSIGEGFLEFEQRKELLLLGITVITSKHEYSISYYDKTSNNVFIWNLANAFYVKNNGNSGGELNTN